MSSYVRLQAGKGRQRGKRRLSGYRSVSRPRPSGGGLASVCGYCELSRSLGSVRLRLAYWVSSSGCVVSEDGLRIACPPPIGSMSLRRISDGTIASGGRVYARPSVG